MYTWGVKLIDTAGSSQELRFIGTPPFLLYILFVIASNTSDIIRYPFLLLIEVKFPNLNPCNVASALIFLTLFINSTFRICRIKVVC